MVLYGQHNEACWRHDLVVGELQLCRADNDDKAIDQLSSELKRDRLGHAVQREFARGCRLERLPLNGDGADLD